MKGEIEVTKPEAGLEIFFEIKEHSDG